MRSSGNKGSFSRFLRLPLLSTFILSIIISCSVKDDEYTAYLFACFVGNGPGQEQVHFAISPDGFNWVALNNNHPVIGADTISARGGVRDPHILRGPDERFYMVLTDLYVPNDGWTNTGMVFLSSDDLVTWTSSKVNIPGLFPEFSDVTRVWAPQTFYDEEEEKFMVYFSMLQPGGYDIIYYAYADDDFTSLATKPEQLFFHPDNKSCIDGDIVYKDGTDLTSLDPGFNSLFGATISPRGPQDFSGGPVNYSISLYPLDEKIYQVTASIDNNPVLEGYYADPEILWSENTGKFYLYPTSDGYLNWGGTYFKAFSSTDLVNWIDEGVILDLPEDVPWGPRNAWAPAAAERLIDGEYKYFYYFTAAQKIGVGVSDSPAGPFQDIGEPLIDWKPDGITRGQEIDPDVFRDPVSGQDYLYWGNSYLAGAKLNPDMISLDLSTLKVMTPADGTFREGIEVFYRNGIYYFLWSENDTRDEDYRVRYAMSDSPMGEFIIPENNLILARDPAQAIYGTGHNCVLQVPGTDDWYIIYHRFTRPKGITMGRRAGFHREVCIDRMDFNPDGTIIPVKPTLSGIDPLD